jgi:hypothetical protein
MKRAIGLALLGLVLALPAAMPADGITPGNWKVVVMLPSGDVETIPYLLNLDTKDGKTSAKLLTPTPSVKVQLVSFDVTGDYVRLVVKNPNEVIFQGRISKDGKKIMGVYGPEQSNNAAYMAPTELTTLEAKDKTHNLGIAELNEITKLNAAAALLALNATKVKDTDEKAKLMKDAAEARSRLEKEKPKLYMETIAKHPNTFAAGRAAMALLTLKGAAGSPQDLKTWAEIASRASTGFGAIWSAEVNNQIAVALLHQKNPATAAEFAAIAEKALDDKCTADLQAKVLQTMAHALAMAGKTTELSNVSARLAKLEDALDNEYKIKVPSFKGEKFAGRKAQSDRAVVMELFTGAQCPPCVAADVAFDVLQKNYQPSELVLIQYHLHIPGPDPMTNKDTEARAKYYKANSTPSTFFNGASKAGGGGAMDAAEKKYDAYRAVIDPLLDTATTCKVKASARRNGDKVDIQTDVAGLEKPGDSIKLRLVLVEETIRFVGSNHLRFHHQVVRAMPGGAEGVAVTNPTMSVKNSVDLKGLRKTLINYLDNYQENVRPFPQFGRPLDFHGLRLIAFVQDDSTKEILQATQVGVLE